MSQVEALMIGMRIEEWRAEQLRKMEGLNLSEDKLDELHEQTRRQAHEDITPPWEEGTE